MAKAVSTSQNPSPAVMGTYARQNVVFSRGEGCWLIDTAGDRYLDFTSGVAVNALGHAHPKLIAALTGQADKLWHTSNLFRVEGQERLAERLVELTFADQVFFCNSGAEACEGAIKAARRHFYVGGNPARQRIITFQGAFHGRTLTTLAAAGNTKYMEGCAPHADGFDVVPLGDIEAVETVITPATAAIMIEPVQGEGGARTVRIEFLQQLRKLADARGLLLIFDEVQTGVGRTGKLFAHEWAGISPDIMAIAKGLGGGFPVGAFLATNEAADGMTAGTHGSTFGGNPLAMAVANGVLDVVTEDGFLENVRAAGDKLRNGLQALAQRYDNALIKEVRGLGLLAGIQLRKGIEPVSLVGTALKEHLLLVGAGDNTVRILPPLTVTESEIEDGLARLDRALAGVQDSAG